MSSLQVSKLHTLTGHRDCVYTLTSSGLEPVFFSAAGDGLVVMWNLDDPRTGSVIAQLPNSIYAIHYHKSSNALVVGHNYDGIHIIDWQNKTELGSLQITKAAIFDIQSHSKDLFIATGDGALIKVDNEYLKIVQHKRLSEKSARSISINEQLGEVAVGFSDHLIRVFDLENLQLKHTIQAHGNSVFTVQYTPDKKFLMSGSRDARLKMWDATKNYEQAAEVVAHMFAINHLAFSPDNKHFVTCSMDKSIKVWAAQELKLLKVIDRARHAGHGTSVNKVLWTNHESQLLSASDDRTISVWNINFEKQQV